MNPDWAKFVEDFCKPVSMLIVMIVAGLFITIGLQFYRDRVRDRAILEKKFGKEITKWILEEE